MVEDLYSLEKLVLILFWINNSVEGVLRSWQSLSFLENVGFENQGISSMRLRRFNFFFYKLC